MLWRLLPLALVALLLVPFLKPAQFGFSNTSVSVSF